MISGTKIAPLRRADIPELSQFLISGFGVPATSSCFSHEVLLWKYFDGPGGPSEDSVCSLIARSAGRIIGHIGICPRQFIVSGDGGRQYRRCTPSTGWARLRIPAREPF